MSRDNGKAEMSRRSLLQSAGVLSLGTMTTVPASASATNDVGASGSDSETAVSESTFTTDQWTRDEASLIDRTEDTTVPTIDHDPQTLLEDEYVWDTWPLRNRDGSMTVLNGWQIIFSLTAYHPTPGGRHSLASIKYFYSRDGKSWQPGGEVFTDALGHHQWAGSAMYDVSKDEVNIFYTATSSQETNFRQRLALGRGARIETGPHGVELTGSFDHQIIAEADGTLYQTLEQSLNQGIIYAFRDPWYFQHPETGEDMILFEGNTPTTGDDPRVNSAWNGNVGVARASSEDLDEWELMPPIIEAIGTNQQLERPHFVFQQGQYYLFFPSHKFTFAPGLQGPDGLYGFVSDSLYGEYEPLNDSGLVLGNPESEPFQTYSWLALPHGDNLVVTSFLNFRGLDDTSLGSIDLTEVGYLPPEEQRDLFGGTLAPSLKVQIDGAETCVTTEFQDGYFPPAVGSRYKETGSNGNGKSR